MVERLTLLLKNVIITKSNMILYFSRYVTSNLLQHNYIFTITEKGFQIDSIYINFRKTFDSINYNYLAI